MNHGPGTPGAILEHSVKLKSLAVSALAGILGGIFCLATGALANFLGLTPNFPAYGGEDDFTFRFTVFGLFVVPAFAGIGVWIARLTLKGRGRWGRGVAGVVAGTVVTFVVERTLRSTIEALPSSHAANVAVVITFLGWIGLAVLGDGVVGRDDRRSGRLIG
jgi:uncharacterized membrane protein YiaA